MFFGSCFSISSVWLNLDLAIPHEKKPNKVSIVDSVVALDFFTSKEGIGLLCWEKCVSYYDLSTVT